MWWMVVIIEAEVIRLLPLLRDSHTEATDREQFIHLAQILSYKMSSHVFHQTVPLPLERGRLTVAAT